MPTPALTELGWLTGELRGMVTPCPFRFEWANARQGMKLLLGGDWSRRRTHTTRTIYGTDGSPIRKGHHPLSTADRQAALSAGQRLVKNWQDGADTRQRIRPGGQPASTTLSHQQRIAVHQVRERKCGDARKRKLLRLTRKLFEWLDERRLTLDSPNAISWASDSVRRDTANYVDRLFVAQWAVELNGMPWVLPRHRRAQAPKVSRPFAENATDQDIEHVFSAITDPTAEAFCRVIAATGCRPSEVAFLDWEQWEREGRPMAVHGFSPKVNKDFVAIIHPSRWLDGFNPRALAVPTAIYENSRNSEETSQRNTHYSSRLLKIVQRDLSAAGIHPTPTWTDLRHLWTIRATNDGMDQRTAALAQAHSEKMVTAVYLRHGEKRQTLAGIDRFINTIQSA